MELNSQQMRSSGSGFMWVSFTPRTNTSVWHDSELPTLSTRSIEALRSARYASAIVALTHVLPLVFFEHAFEPTSTLNVRTPDLMLWSDDIVDPDAWDFPPPVPARRVAARIHLVGRESPLPADDEP